MSDACDHCAKPVKSDDEFVTCMAFCERMVHIRCSVTKLNKPFVKIIQESPNLIWMCDECVKLMKIARFKSVVSSFGDVIQSITEKQEAVHAEFRKELEKHGKQLALLSKRMTPSSPLLNAPSSSSRLPPSKRRRDEEFNSIPVVSKPLLGGTKEMTTDSILTVPEQIELFYLYLSRIHPSVKPEAVEKLAKDSLQCDDIKVIPLIKRGIDTSRLNFVSYKIGIDPKFREAALNPDTWPKGVLFREFEDQSTKNMWQPCLNTPTMMASPSVSPAVGASQFFSPTNVVNLEN